MRTPKRHFFRWGPDESSICFTTGVMLSSVIRTYDKHNRCKDGWSHKPFLSIESYNGCGSLPRTTDSKEWHSCIAFEMVSNDKWFRLECPQSSMKSVFSDSLFCCKKFATLMQRNSTQNNPRESIDGFFWAAESKRSMILAVYHRALSSLTFRPLIHALVSSGADVARTAQVLLFYLNDSYESQTWTSYNTAVAQISPIPMQNTYDQR
jgi:hypothetical protein